MTPAAQPAVAVSRRVMRRSSVACARRRSPIRVLRRFSFVGCSALVAEVRVGGVDLDSMSERELERLHAGLLKLAGLPDEELGALVGSLLEGEELASSE